MGTLGSKRRLKSGGLTKKALKKKFHFDIHEIKTDGTRGKLLKKGVIKAVDRREAQIILLDKQRATGRNPHHIASAISEGTLPAKSSRGKLGVQHTGGPGFRTEDVVGLGLATGFTVVGLGVMAGSVE